MSVLCKGSAHDSDEFACSACRLSLSQYAGQSLILTLYCDWFKCSGFPDAPAISFRRAKQISLCICVYVQDRRARRIRQEVRRDVHHTAHNIYQSKSSSMSRLTCNFHRHSGLDVRLLTGLSLHPSINRIILLHVRHSVRQIVQLVLRPLQQNRC